MEFERDLKMNDDSKLALEYPSTAFHINRSKSGRTTILTVVLVVLVILAVYAVVYAFAGYRKPCSQSPTTPTKVQAGYLNKGSFRLTWIKIPDVPNYVVYIGESASFTRQKSINVTTVASNQADIKGLATGRTYYILVSAKNSCGESANSEVIAFNYVEF